MTDLTGQVPAHLSAKGNIMQDKSNGWKQPEEKFPETELEDNFSEFFSEDEISAPKGKYRRHKSAGPDILAVTDSEQDEGFIIKEVVAFDGEDGLVQVAKQDESAPEESESEADVAVSTEETLSTEACSNNEPTLSTEEAEPEAAEPAAEDAPTSAEDTEQPTESEGTAEPSEEAAAAEPTPEKPKKTKKVLFPRAKKIINKKRRHKYVAAIGAVLIALAIVGAISVVSLGVKLVARFLDNTNQKEAFEWKVYPVLMLDPATFDDPSQLDEVFLLKTAMWSTLLENRTIYTYDENGMLIVPASDLDVASKKLYGDAVTLKHQTFSEEYEYFYIFNEDTNTYSVPISGQTPGYTPKVVKVNKSGDIYTLIVGYVEPTTLWNMSEDGSFTESVPSKYLYYDLQRLKGGNYIIKSIRSIPKNELPDDLEVASQQSLNQTQYIDYDEIYQEYLNNQENELAGKENTDGEINSDSSTDSSGDSSSEESSSDSSSSSGD